MKLISNSHVNSIAQYVDLGSAPSPHPRPPYCDQALPFSMAAFDHLEGVSARHELKNVTEPSLLSVMPYIKNPDDWGDKVRMALERVS